MKSYVYLQDAKYEGMLEGKLEGRQEDRAEAILELLDEIGPVPQELILKLYSSNGQKRVLVWGV